MQYHAEKNISKLKKSKSILILDWNRADDSNFDLLIVSSNGSEKINKIQQNISHNIILN